MRVTRVMKEYVEKQVNEKRHALGVANRASYEARRKECVEIIRARVAEFRKEIDAILVSYNMDNPAVKREADGYNSREVISFYDGYVTNAKEVDGHRKYEQKLRDREREMLEAFYLECDLGINKEGFLSAVAALNFDEN